MYDWDEHSSLPWTPDASQSQRFGGPLRLLCTLKKHNIAGVGMWDRRIPWRPGFVVWPQYLVTG